MSRSAKRSVWHFTPSPLSRSTSVPSYHRSVILPNTHLCCNSTAKKGRRNLKAEAIRRAVHIQWTWDRECMKTTHGLIDWWLEPNDTSSSILLPSGQCQLTTHWSQPRLAVLDNQNLFIMCSWFCLTCKCSSFWSCSLQKHIYGLLCPYW
jgi:hypothetical protein